MTRSTANPSHPSNNRRLLSENRARAEAGCFALTVGGRLLDLSRQTLVMGILNVTPDSFSDGGRYLDVDRAVDRALCMAEEGADIIDIGGESSRPGARPVSEEEETRRVVDVIEAIRKRIDTPLSIDTYKAGVARRAVEAGASLINDISALTFDPNMAPLAARLSVPVILMHIKGTPRDMQKDPRYTDLIGEIKGFLDRAIQHATGSGIDPERIIIDPGIGFGKTAEDNLTLIGHIRDFFDLGRPVLIGASRKSFIGALTGKPVNDRLWGSIGAAAAAALLGAHIVRVHDVAETRDALAVVDAINRRDR
ncbi:MAG: dihydropteroate synthase [Deltaproteobacteria bacterium]|nr:dihydropteroate synthase [Candidatus Zymogenaceae bacterium]